MLLYAWVGATMTAPSRATDSAAAMAAMPEEKTSADPPSRAPRASSNAVHVGLPRAGVVDRPVGDVRRGELQGGVEPAPGRAADGRPRPGSKRGQGLR